MDTDDLARAVRAADPERHLSTLYAPENRRMSLLVLYAFDAEIAGLRERVREPLAGEIRLQWWRDAIAAPAGQKTGSPLADALRDAIEEHRLPVPAFEALLEARIFDLYADPMPSVTDLEGYCGETASSVIQLAAMILDRDAATAAAAAAGHAGCAKAIAAIAARVGWDRRSGRCFFPRDLLAAAGTDPEQFVAGDDAPSATRAVVAAAALARHHLSAFEDLAVSLPATIRPAFLPLAVLPAWLERLERRPDRALLAPVAPPVFARHWLTLRRGVRGWTGR